jgi:hypothetical protein
MAETSAGRDWRDTSCVAVNAPQPGTEVFSRSERADNEAYLLPLRLYANSAVEGTVARAARRLHRIRNRARSGSHVGRKRPGAPPSWVLLQTVDPARRSHSGVRAMPARSAHRHSDDGPSRLFETNGKCLSSINRMVNWPSDRWSRAILESREKQHVRQTFLHCPDDGLDRLSGKAKYDRHFKGDSISRAVPIAVPLPLTRSSSERFRVFPLVWRLSCATA